MVAAHSKPGRDTLSSQIAREEWSLLVVAKRLASSVKGSSHYSLPFPELKHPLYSSSFPLSPVFYSLGCARSASGGFCPKSGTKPPCAPKQGLLAGTYHSLPPPFLTSRPSKRAIGRCVPEETAGSELGTQGNS